jgi:TRAP-type C4-dicarboxylate transport system permease small subunit
MNLLLPFIVPFAIYIVLVVYGFSLIKKNTEVTSSAKTFWYIFMALMPFVALIVFYFVEDKPRVA